MMADDNFGGVNAFSFFGTIPANFIYGTAVFTLSESEGQHGRTFASELTALFNEADLPAEPRKVWVELTGNDGLSYRLGDNDEHLFWEKSLEGGPTPESPKRWKVRIFGQHGKSPLAAL